DATALPFVDACYDKSCSFSTLFFVPNQERAIKEISRVSNCTTIELANRLSIGGLVTFFRGIGLATFNLVRKVMGFQFAVRLASLFFGEERAARLASYTELGLFQPYFPIW